MFTVKHHLPLPPETDWQERQAKKDRLRVKLHQENRAGFPAHFSYEQLSQFANFTVKPHEYPTRALSEIDHPSCFNHWPIGNILREADRLQCESHLSLDCRAILNQFKLMVRNNKKEDPLIIFSEAVSTIEKSKLS